MIKYLPVLMCDTLGHGEDLLDILLHKTNKNGKQDNEQK